MTFAQLLQSQPSLTELRGLWLVLSSDLKDALLAKQDQHGNDSMQVQPIALTDGRWALCADMLSELHERGLYRAAFLSLDQSRFSEVEVIPADQLSALLPAPEGEL